MNIHVLPFVGYGGIIAAGEVTPILPVAGEKQPDNITKFFFDALIQFVVSEVLSHTFSTKKNTHNTHNLYHSLDKSADDKLILFFFFTENRLWHFMQIVSLHEISVILENKKKYFKMLSAENFTQRLRVLSVKA